MAETVDTDETPAQALSSAAEAVRRFAHASGPHFDERPGWEYPNDAYDCVSTLVELAGRLPVVFDQLSAAVRDQLALHLVDVDAGHRFEGDPEGAVAALGVSFDQARVAVQHMLAGLNEAHTVLSGLSHGGPDSRPGERP